MRYLTTEDLAKLHFTEPNVGMQDTEEGEGIDNYQFCTSQAYETFQTPQDDSHKAFWHKLWSIRGPSSANFLLWQTSLARLPSASILFQRRCLESPACPRCNDQNENNMHAVRDCRYSANLWKRVLKTQDVAKFFQYTDEKEWIAGNLSNGSNYWTLMFREMLKQSWANRNKQIFQKDQYETSPDKVVEIAKRNVHLIIQAEEARRRGIVADDGG